HQTPGHRGHPRAFRGLLVDLVVGVRVVGPVDTGSGRSGSAHRDGRAGRGRAAGVDGGLIGSSSCRGVTGGRGHRGLLTGPEVRIVNGGVGGWLLNGLGGWAAELRGGFCIFAVPVAVVAVPVALLRHDTSRMSMAPRSTSTFT